jgi:hypothetical protein
MMNKTRRYFWLDVMIFLAFLITATTGFLFWQVIPLKLGAAFLGFSRSVWVAAHIFSGMLGFAFIVMHIIWHWDWFKALRGRPLNGISEKLRANRIVDRVMWINYIAANVFGMIAWMIHSGDDIYVASVPNRLHLVFGMVWTILATLHLVLHWKWIAFTTQRYRQANLQRTNDSQGKEIAKRIT